MKVEAPPLAQYRGIDEYTNPKYGDFVIWQGLFKTKYCLVNSYDKQNGVVSLITEATPRLLFTSTQEEMGERAIVIKLSDIQNWKDGHFYVMQETNGKQLWYT